MLSPAVVARLTLCPLLIITLSAGPGMIPPTQVETVFQFPVWAEEMVLWEKVEWEKKEKITDVRMAKRIVLLLLASLIIPQFVDTIRLLMNNHISR
jgi:hypothetical protein